MQSLRTWFSGGTDSIRLMVGLDDLEGLLQPKQFYDSTLLNFKLGSKDSIRETSII